MVLLDNEVLSREARHLFYALFEGFIQEDALQFIMAGATAIQVGSANFADPGAMIRIVDGLADFCREQKVFALRDLVGCLEAPDRGW